MPDLRTFLATLDKAGEVNVVEEEVSPYLQAPVVAAMSNRVGDKAPWFKKIKGYPEGYTMAGSLLTGPGTMYRHERWMWGRIALALEMDKNVGWEALIDEFVERRMSPISPMEVSSGPCKEEIHMGKEADLFEFPIPLLTENDGGKYITAAFTVTRDLDFEWANWGCYRWMVKDAQTLVGNLRPGQHLNKIYQKYEAAGKPMPACIVLGGDPVCLVASAMTLPEGVSEAEMAGGLRLDPIDLVKAETNNLLVPANAEIVIEGEVLPYEREEEGPFPEYIGLSARKKQPVFKVRAITHRKNPIFPFVVEGTKVSDSMAIRSVVSSAEIMRDLKYDTRWPVRWVYLLPEARLGMLVVATQQFFKGYLALLTEFLNFRRPIHWYDKIMVVDPDVEVEDLHHLLNDWVTKHDPAQNLYTSKGMNMPITPTTGYLTAEEMERGVTSTCVFDTTIEVERKPEEIPIRASFENCFPKAIRDRVLERWKKDYGFEKEPVLKYVPRKWQRGIWKE